MRRQSEWLDKPSHTTSSRETCTASAQMELHSSASPPPKEGRMLIRDIHSGECGHHSSARTLAGKVFRSGFYWPQVLQDATTIVQSCDACQFHAKQVHQPALGLQTIPLSWPFAVWGLHILGPFPISQEGYCFLFVAVDKFTKWAEVEAVRSIPARAAVKFIRGLICRFGVPNRIITDRKSTRLNSSHIQKSRMPSSA